MKDRQNPAPADNAMFEKHTSRLALTLAALLSLLATGCARDAEPLPEPGSDAYREVVISFYTSLAALQAGESLGAREEMERVTELAPGEPAGWANLGLIAHRQGDFAEARSYLSRALELAPDDARILLLLARLESDEGGFDEALRLLRRAAESEPENPKVVFTLAREVERQGGADSAAVVGNLLDRAVALRPDNLALLLERIRIAALEENAAAASETLGQLVADSEAWPDEIRERLLPLEAAVANDSWNDVATQVALLRNLLLELPAFRADLLAVQTPAAEVGDLVLSFVRLTPPDPRLAPADTLAFEPLDFPGGPWTRAELLRLTNETAPVLAAVDARGLHLEATLLPLPGPASLPPHGIAALDVDADYLNDVAVAAPAGVRLFIQESDGFRDVTEEAFPPGVSTTAATGVWVADLDTEGDLDLVVGRSDAPPLVLRNNGDNTFTPTEPFEAGNGLRDFAWADFDGDGDPDAALLDAEGAVHVIVNDRRGAFQVVPTPAGLAPVSALVAGDVVPGGALDLVVLTTAGEILRLAPEVDGSSAWIPAPVTRWEGIPAPIQVGAARLFVEDFDNNGGLDLVASSPTGTRAWLRDADGNLQPGPTLEVPVTSVADLNADGRLDFLGRTPTGQALGLLNRGKRAYHYQVLRPSGLSQGDQRINSFGIGGVVEVRSGLLYQQKPITGPFVHFGLGEHESAELVRIIWPNGDVQAEFDLPSNAVVSTPQRLKGSCPWVFTFDGEGMRFVTDFIWRSPLGLSINAQETAGVMTTEDWVKIEGDELVPRNGFYDVRITAELWESHFFDHVSLLVVDHPADQEIFVDERFAFPPPPLAVQATTPLRPVAGAWDDAGRDVTDLVRAEDGRYLGGFARGRYQGVAEAHYVEVDLGDNAAADGPLRLVASGWVRPTDSSINVALSQGAHAPPEGLSLEVPDGDGGWRVAADGLGFPAGKTKTIVLDLEGLFASGMPRRLRLRTNLEIYWDALTWAVALPADSVHTRSLAPETADLRYRGFSVVTQADRTSPELPEYDVLAGTAPRWRDLEGFYTRFGDVRELLDGVDDRYVIMNAGDELRFRFPALPPAPEGWTRDFVLVGDGWVKDGDLNTAFSKTVRPLPAHDRPAYDTPPGRLEDDPVYRRHASDWVRYHTRYVTPEAFRQALQLR